MQLKPNQSLITEALSNTKQKPKLSLADLRPRSGDPVRLETRIPKGRYSVRLIGVHEQTAVLVSAPKTRKSLFTEGAVIAVKLLIGNRLVSFISRLLKSHSEPFPYWVLSYPQELEIQAFRQHTRVPMHLPVLVDRGESDMHQPVRALCVDMSLKGASIEAPVALAAVGDSIFVTARVSLAGVDHVIMTNALVRTVMQTESQALGVFRHGVAFDGLEDDTRLILSGFIYQQWLYEAGELLELESF
ncbi:MAG: flagellar brake protein [Oceanospirillales bacterium]|nr:MAG: flagellar brake protein [Oceanospirillales bacterium]